MPKLGDDKNRFSDNELTNLAMLYVQSDLFRIQHDIPKPPLFPSKLEEVKKIIQGNYSPKYNPYLQIF